MTSRMTRFAALILTLIFTTQAPAQTLTTFTNGQPADANAVNANFNTLLTEINNLKSQVAALQAATPGASVSLAQALVGTWDTVSLDTAAFEETTGEGFNLRGSGGKGTVTFNANGTFTGVTSSHSNSLWIANNISAACIPGGTTQVNCLPKSNITVAANLNQTDSSTDSGTWSLSGNLLTVTVGGESQTGRISANGNVLVFQDYANPDINMTIAIKRP